MGAVLSPYQGYAVPSGPAGGDTSGTYPDPTVTGLHVNGLWTPPVNNLIWGTYNPELASASPVPSAASVAGCLTLRRVLLYTPELLTTISYEIAVVDAGGLFGPCYLGLYDSTGTLQAITADISGTFTVAFEHPINWVTPYSAPAGEYFIALLLTGTWTVLSFKSSGGGVSSNMQLAKPHLDLSNLLTGQTTLPAGITLANQATNLISGGWGSQIYGLK